MSGGDAERELDHGAADESLDQPHSVAFGRYELIATLGRGGMADVYLAVARGPMGFNKLVVLKRLRRSPGDEDAIVTMFLDEARLAARLNHANVVHTYEVGAYRGAYFIAMEYLEGQSLQRILRDRSRMKADFAPTMAARIISDALAGLHHAHELTDYDGSPLTIIHRDISPHNIFVTYEGQSKIVDFGIAKAASTTTQTDAGVVKGKTAYMAPEQALGLPLDRRADIFPMGIVLWEMLTMQRLMVAESSAGSLHKLLNVPIPRVSSAVPNIDPRLDAIVAKALERDVDKRYATARDMRNDLEEYIAAAGPVSHDEVGALVTSMFAKVREEVKQRIQREMRSAAGSMTTDELARISLESTETGESVGAGAFAHEVSTPLPDVPSLPVAPLPKVKPLRMPPADLFPSLPSIEPPPLKPRERAWRGTVIFLGSLCVLAALAARFPEYVPFRSSHAHDAATTNAADVPRADDGAGALPSASPVPTAAPALLAVAPSAEAAAAVAIVPPAPLAEVDASTTKPPWHRPMPSHTVATVLAPSTEPPAEAPGFLTFDSFPWTRVSEGSRVLGTTPLVRIALASGTHTLSLENPEQHLTQTVTVTIKPNETVVKRLALK